MGYALADLLLGGFGLDEADTGRLRPERQDVILAQLLTRLRSGDERALELLFRRLADPMAAFAQRVGICSADAEQIVVDVFHDLWSRRETAASHGKIEAYLFRAVRNRALDAMRSGQRRATYEGRAGHDFVSESDASHELTREEVIAAVWAAVEALPEGQQTALYLRYTREMPIHDIAQTMGTSAGAVKMLLQRAVKTLRAEVGGVFGEL